MSDERSTANIRVHSEDKEWFERQADVLLPEGADAPARVVFACLRAEVEERRAEDEAGIKPKVVNNEG